MASFMITLCAIIFIFIIAYGIAVYTGDAHLPKFPTKKQRKASQFYEISQSVLQERIKDKSELLYVFQNVAKSDDFYSYKEFLKEFLVWLMMSSSKDSKDSNDSHLEQNEVKSVKDFISQILEQENEIKPYSGVPENEKSVLISIDTLTENNDNSKAIKQQLEKLSNAFIN